MRILIFHGYLLRGTGSNVYNAGLAQALKRLGHEVHLLCQDREASELDWVGDGPGQGSVTVHVPDIGGLLPVFVADRYEGFEVKTFPELSDAELERYLDANVEAVRDVVESVGAPDAALANHLIMGPAILARAGLKFAIKVHGSDLSYTVRADPDRFVPFAREGTDASAGILVGSRHTAEDLWSTVEDPGLPEQTRLGPPGVDVDRFKISERPEAERAAIELAGRLGADGGSAFGRDAAAAAGAIEAWSAGERRVLFVGKLLVNKGVDLLAAAWPLIHRGHPAARLMFAGFGAYEPGLRALIAALDEGNLDEARAVAALGRAHEGQQQRRPQTTQHQRRPQTTPPNQPLPILAKFLDAPPEGYAEAARAAAGTIGISGRLEHDEVAAVMPAADAFVMPSTFPEAFGMVAAEAAACGVPPVSADHSGMREVSRRLADAVGPERASLLSFTAAPGAVEELASRVDGWLSLDPTERERIGRALAARVAELWSWERVANGMIAASRGDLDSLPRVAE